MRTLTRGPNMSAFATGYREERNCCRPLPLESIPSPTPSGTQTLAPPQESPTIALLFFIIKREREREVPIQSPFFCTPPTSASTSARPVVSVEVRLPLYLFLHAPENGARRSFLAHVPVVLRLSRPLPLPLPGSEYSEYGADTKLRSDSESIAPVPVVVHKYIRRG